MRLEMGSVHTTMEDSVDIEERRPSLLAEDPTHAVPGHRIVAPSALFQVVGVAFSSGKFRA